MSKNISFLLQFQQLFQINISFDVNGESYSVLVEAGISFNVQGECIWSSVLVDLAPVLMYRAKST